MPHADGIVPVLKAPGPSSDPRPGSHPDLRSRSWVAWIRTTSCALVPPPSRKRRPESCFFLSGEAMTSIGKKEWNSFTDWMWVGGGFDELVGQPGPHDLLPFGVRVRHQTHP